MSHFLSLEVVESLLDRFMLQLPIEADSHNDYHEPHNAAQRVDEVPSYRHHYRCDELVLTFNGCREGKGC